jgi:hypothetical protein
MTMMIRRAGILSLLLLGGSGALYPCGGPVAYTIDAPLVPGRNYLEGLIESDYETGERRPEIRFLYPLRVTSPGVMETIWALAYGPDEGSSSEPFDSLVPTEPEAGQLEEAEARGDLPAADSLARVITAQVLDMPSVQADTNQHAFRLALEFLELRDTLARVPAADREKTLEQFRAEIQGLPRAGMGAFAEAHPRHPRAASLRYVAIQEAMKHDIPDGWRDEIQKQMSPADWGRLDELHDRWLKDYPTHPLADLVMLSRLRLSYFEGDDRKAWDLLCRAYPRHPVRVLWEMRHLIVAGASGGLDSLTLSSGLDPQLRTALLGEVPAGALSAADWTTLWQLSLQHIREPWAISLQERLLQKVAEWPDSAPLPEGFPRRAANPVDGLGHPTLWGYFRALALLRTGHHEEALEQVRFPGMPKEVGSLRVKLYLDRSEWSSALRDPDLDPYARRYLLWVLAPDSVLTSLAGGSSETARDARLAMAVHVVRRGGWLAGAKLIATSHPAMAALWRQAGILSADSSLAGTLAYARFLRDHADGLYFDLSRSHMWYRGLEYRRSSLVRRPGGRDTRLPWTLDEERADIERHYVETSAMYDALRTYASYLNRAPPKTANLSRIVHEADQVYNLMVNWDHSDSGFWVERILGGPEGEAIRRAGKQG